VAIKMSERHTRRSLLTAVAAAAAGAVAASVSGARRVLAAGDDGKVLHVGDDYFDVTNPTTLWNNSGTRPVLSLFCQGTALSAGTSDGRAIEAVTPGGIGVIAFTKSGKGIFGRAETGEGVRGSSDSGTGVHGIANMTSGIAVNYPAAVLGEARLPNAGAMLANNYASNGLAVGVQGTSDSPTGLASIGWARNGGTGVSGVVGATFPTIPPRTGVYGKAPDRGGVFIGGKAQVRLVPSASATHPSSGALGDLFLDKNKRLWFCLGGKAWKRVQLV
jgi:hypothetical protein